MKFRWTVQELEIVSDNVIMQTLITERISDLNPGTPLCRRLNKIYVEIQKRIMVEKIVERQNIIKRKEKIKACVIDRVNIDLYKKLVKLDDMGHDTFDKFDHMFEKSSDEEIINAIMDYCVNMPYNYFGGNNNGN